MKVAPRLLLAMLASLFVGCRTANTNSIAHTRPPENRARSTFDVDQFVAEHNENAARIRSVEARASIGGKIGPPGKERAGGFDGRLALERPRNFKLEMFQGAFGRNIADIGSNDEEFWFWFSNQQDKSVYYCNYEDLGSTSLAVTYQPDWIVEAMGLKKITSSEAAQIKSRPGPLPGTTELAFPPTRAGGQTYSRDMIVSDRTLQVHELRIKDTDGKTVIAQATINKYQTLPVGRRTSSPSEAGPVATETCVLPEKIVLEWKKELIALDVALRDMKVNQFDPARRSALFVEPIPGRGYTRANLAERARQKRPEGSTAVRETMPVPEQPSSVRLSPPLQIRDSDESAKTSSQPGNSGASSAMLLGVADLDVVTAPAPTAP
ncbi:MAG: hypothetical protein ACP5XB_17970, partial [Isosphaeraceae bacterium]